MTRSRVESRLVLVLVFVEHWTEHAWHVLYVVYGTIRYDTMRCDAMRCDEMRYVSNAYRVIATGDIDSREVA